MSILKERIRDICIRCAQASNNFNMRYVPHESQVTEEISGGCS